MLASTLMRNDTVRGFASEDTTTRPQAGEPDMEMDHTLAPATRARDRRCAPVAVSEESPVGDVRVHGCSKGGGYRWYSGAGEALATRLKRVGDRVGPEGPFGSGHGRAQHGASQSATRNGRGECQAINAILAPMKSK